jgi:hypothetical protein
MTPMHMLTEVQLKALNIGRLNNTGLEFWRWPYKPLPIHTGQSEELLHRQALAVYFLLKLGNDPSLRCIDGLTPSRDFDPVHLSSRGSTP